MCCIRVLIRLFCMICVGFLFMHQTGSCICWSQLVSAGVSFSRESYPGRENSILSVQLSLALHGIINIWWLAVPISLGPYISLIYVTRIFEWKRLLLLLVLM